MKATIELNIDEVFELIRYNKSMANMSPTFDLDTVMLSGRTYREVVQKRIDRVNELDRILNRTWPK